MKANVYKFYDLRLKYKQKASVLQNCSICWQTPSPCLLTHLQINKEIKEKSPTEIALTKDLIHDLLNHLSTNPNSFTNKNIDIMLEKCQDYLAELTELSNALNVNITDSASLLSILDKLASQDRHDIVNKLLQIYLDSANTIETKVTKTTALFSKERKTVWNKLLNNNNGWHTKLVNHITHIARNALVH